MRHIASVLRTAFTFPVWVILDRARHGYRADHPWRRKFPGPVGFAAGAMPVVYSYALGTWTMLAALTACVAAFVRSLT